ncbi:D-alanine--D-alanine ligase [Thermodesulfobacteriota bacterium]
MKKLTIALLSGGISSEREVSLDGGDQVFEALSRDKFRVIRYDPKTDLSRLIEDAPGIDAALIILHGSNGEDGAMQGLMDLLDIPYQGSGVLGSAIAMDKLATKRLYESAGLPVPSYLAVKQGDHIEPKDCINRFGLPLVIKPVKGGSSIGTSIVWAMASFAEAVNTAFEHDNTILIEKYINGIELTVGVIGNSTLTALPVIEIIPEKGHEFFDYTAKYSHGETREICPARIDDSLMEKAQTYAKIAHRSLFCEGYSRTDMIFENEELFVLETNTIPGMTQGSLLPLAAKTAGVKFSRLLEILIELGIEAHQNRK